MPNTTTNLGLNTWLESEIFDVDQVNENFEKLDAIPMIKLAGTIYAPYTGGVSGNVAWHYREYTDGTIDMWTKLEFSTLVCNQGSVAPYYSADETITLPIELTSVFDVQMSLASNTIGWVSNITGASVLDYVKFRVMNMALENTGTYKQVFISVKGEYRP